MPLDTLWESICRLSGEEGKAQVQLDEAVERSAVPKSVAVVEVRQMAEDGLIETQEETITLTDRGRKSRAETLHKPLE